MLNEISPFVRENYVVHVVPAIDNGYVKGGLEFFMGSLCLGPEMGLVGKVSASLLFVSCVVLVTLNYKSSLLGNLYSREEIPKLVERI